MRYMGLWLIGKGPVLQPWPAVCMRFGRGVHMDETTCHDRRMFQRRDLIHLFVLVVNNMCYTPGAVCETSRPPKLRASDRAARWAS